jgi:AcrR family transcriptional regulator
MATSPTGRGEATREALIRAALEIFGRDGFQAASTRAIASAAGVNQAAIGFHFGGKQGLYNATFRYVMGRVTERLGPVLEGIEAQLRTRHDKKMSAADRLEHCLPLVYRLTDGLVAMFTSEESKSWARLILREQQDPTAAFEAHYDESFGRISALVTDLIARAQNRTVRDRRVRLTVPTMIGQALIFRAGAATVMRHLGCRRYGDKEVAEIQALIRRNVAAMLKAGVKGS